MTPQDGYHFSDQIGHLLRRVYQRHTALFQQYIPDSQLTAAQFVVLCSVRDNSGSSLADLPTIRAYLARAQLRLEQARLLRDDTVAAVQAARADARTRLLQSKAAAAEAALEVTDIAMRVCGGAAFRKELGIERLFRDARAASVMAPTTDVIYDMLGKGMCDAAA